MSARVRKGHLLGLGNSCKTGMREFFESEPENSNRIYSALKK